MPGRLRSGQVCGHGFSLSTVGSVAPTQGVRPALPSHWPRGWLQDGCRTLKVFTQYRREHPEGRPLGFDAQGRQSSSQACGFKAHFVLPLSSLRSPESLSW